MEKRNEIGLLVGGYILNDMQIDISNKLFVVLSGEVGMTAINSLTFGSISISSHISDFYQEFINHEY